MANKKLIIKEIAKSKGMTLENLASKLGIKRTSLSQALTRNSFSTDKLSDIADVLGVEIVDLFEAKQETCKMDENKMEGLNIICPYCNKLISLHIDKTVN